MPSPLGHALAGMAIAWSAEAIKRQPLGFGSGSALAVTCVGLAVCPDLDFLYPPVHRMMTHSLLVGVAVGAVVAGVNWRRRGGDTIALTLACSLAYASHLLLDWLGGDTKLPAGIQLLWPFSDGWYISSFGVFRATDLGGFFEPRVMLSNGLAVLRELILLTPFALAACAWRWRRWRVHGG